MPSWKKENWRIHSKPIWGGPEIWNQIWDHSSSRSISIGHVNAPTGFPPNNTADALVQIKSTTQSPVEEDEKIDIYNLGQWAHEQCGHRGAEGTYDWAKTKGIPLTQIMARDIVFKCIICQQLNYRKTLSGDMGSIYRGQQAAKVWQMDFIGPLPPGKGKKQYCCTAVDTYPGVLLALPTEHANQECTLKMLADIITHYGTPVEIQTDNGTHFTGRKVRDWAKENYVYWVYHIPYYPQSAGLIERMNGLLKEQIRKRTPMHTLKGWVSVLQEAVCCLNERVLTGSTTPFQRLLEPPPPRPPHCVTLRSPSS